MMSGTILVTGGTGFLGKHLVRALSQSGDGVRLLVRPSRSVPEMEAWPGVEIVRGDVTDAASVKTAMSGVDRVFHAAGLVKKWLRDRSTFDRVNVEGVDSLLEVARGAGVRRVVYTSSFMAIGHSDRAGLATEATLHEANHDHNDYERTKRLAEEVAGRHVAEGFDVVTVVPGVIYGPGELTEGNLVVKIFCDFLRGKLPGIPGPGDQRWCYAFVDDVVSGHMAAMDRGARGGRYILGGENATLDELFAQFARLSGRPAPKRHLPFWLLSSVGALEELLAWGIGREPNLTRGIVGVYRHHWAYDCARARRELGYTVTPLAEGLSRTFEWMLEAGLVPQRYRPARSS